jgi:hypothetical protein
MTESDIFDIQMEAERVARQEYEDAFRSLQDAKDRHDVVLTSWKSISSVLKGLLMKQTGITDHNAIEDDAIVDFLRDELTELMKLKKMFKLINENALLQAQWDKLVMSIRLVGGDENDDKSTFS